MLSACGLSEKICRALVFFPPAKTYQFKDNQVYLVNGDGELCYPSDPDLVCQHSISVPPSRNALAAYMISQAGAKKTLLFSHGNATDIGAMRDHLIDLSNALAVNIFAYDYSGYGWSDGMASHSNVKRDIESAYHYLVDVLGVDPLSIVLYGQSLGTGACCHLASSPLPIGGVILHSPLMSALRVIRDLKRSFYFDIFPNIDLIGLITVPVFIIHGSNDREIPREHGERLYEASKKLYKPWFVDGAGHNDIEAHWRREYIHQLDEYLRYLNRVTTTQELKSMV